MISILKKGN